jgi:hypothetical protein
MSRRQRTVVCNIRLVDAEGEHRDELTFLRRPYRLVRVGAGGDLDTAVELIRSWAARADAIALTGVREAQTLGLFDPDTDGGLELLEEAAVEVPIVDGRTLHDVLQEWAIRHVHAEMPGYFSNARTVVLGGTDHDRTTRILREFTPNLEFADPLLRLDLPARLDSNPVLGLAVKAGTWPTLHLVPASLRLRLRTPLELISRELARVAARDCDVVVASYEELVDFGLEDLAGKTVVTSAISDERLAELGSRGVDMVLDTTPSPSTSPSRRPSSRP